MKACFKPMMLLAAMLAVLGNSAPDKMDPANPTCPQEPDWSDYSEMKLTPVEKDGTSVLLAEGFVDAGLPERLRKALTEHDDITEIWLRSPGETRAQEMKLGALSAKKAGP